MLWLYLRAIFGLSLVTIASIGAGAWIPSALPPSFRPFERVAFLLLGGLGLLSSALFLVGQISFTRTSIIVVLGVSIMSAIVPIFRTLSNSMPLTSITPRIHKVPGTIIALVLVLTAVSGLAEITGDWNSDTVAYHLLGPKVWLREGVIRPVLDNSHTAFPQIPETLFAALWSVGGSRAPNFSSFLTLGLLLVMAASIASRLGLSDEEAWWAAALVATMPAVVFGGIGCFVDAIFAAFVIAATRIGLDARHLREWVMFGIFCGFVIGTKYTGLLAIPALMICISLLNLKQSGTGSGFRLAGNLALAIATACLVGSPYYIRNWVLLGCPIYPPPPGYALFCSPKYLSTDAIARFHAYIRHRGMGLGRGISAFLLLPFNLTYHTSNFHGAGGIGLCPLALSPLGIFSVRRNAVAKNLVLLMFMLTAAWFVTQQESRFLIHSYVISAVFSILGWRSVLSNGRKVSKYLAFTIVFLSCSYGLFMIAKANVDNARAALSPEYANLRHETSIPYVRSFEYLNHHSSVRKVLILDRSVPPHYLDKNYVKPVGQWGERTLPGEPDSVEALAKALTHQLDASHILDVNSEVSGFQIDPRTAGLTLVFEAENQRVYRVN